jgi:hypothetical protein
MRVKLVDDLDVSKVRKEGVARVMMRAARSQTFGRSVIGRGYEKGQQIQQVYLPHRPLLSVRYCRIP